MSLYGHGVISLRVLLPGLNLHVSREFMKTCELGLTDNLEEYKDDAVTPQSDFCGHSDDHTTGVCLLTSVQDHSHAELIKPEWISRCSPGEVGSL